MRVNVLVGLMCWLAVSGFGQKRIAEFPFDTHTRAMNVNTAVGFGSIQLKVADPEVLEQTPTVITDTDDVTKVMFFKFKANFNASTNNIHVALAPKQGNKVKITHIEFRLRFGSNKSGNAGIFISKDPETVNNTLIWSCGNNQTFDKFKDFVVSIPDSDLTHSESPGDSIRFVFSQGTNTQGMYIDNFVVYGVVNDAYNPVTTIQVDAAAITKELADRPSGANTCWLMDSDIKWPRSVSNESRFAEMKLGALRFPYGHLADNYLWHKPGAYSTVAQTGPIPVVASPGTPANWSWAVNPADNTFKKDLGFDEFIAICKRHNIEPLIVVNAQAHTYVGGPTYEQLKQNAIEWVRYANITKGYGVKNWQIGNEVEHQTALTMNTYTSLFLDFATAMKAVDPTIHVGTGVLSNTNWNKDVLTKAGALCDFVSTHNYQFGNAIPPGGFRSWYQTNSVLITNTTTTQNMINNAFPDRTELEIHVTETNITGGDFPDMGNIDLYKALYWFEMNMNHLALKNIRYTYFWGTHSPWGGETNLGDISCLLENSAANTIRPSGRVIQLINTYLKKYWLNVSRVNGYIRAYASVGEDGKALSVFLLNKNLYPEKIELDISNFNVVTSRLKEKITFTGNSFNDTNPVILKDTLPEVPDQITLPPYSLTILNFSSEDENTVITTTKQNTFHAYFCDSQMHTNVPFTNDSLVCILSLDGKTVFTAYPAAGSSSIVIPTLSHGVYLAKIVNDECNQMIKFIK